MKGFSTFSKSVFLSQLLFGLVAIFALPSVSMPVEQHNSPICEQQTFVYDLSALKKAEIEQTLFLQQVEYALFLFSQQAGGFCEFYALLYRLPHLVIPPIRAGPQYIV